MTRRADLIARLEAAEVGDWDLNEAVGYSTGTFLNGASDFCTTSLDAALALCIAILCALEA